MAKAVILSPSEIEVISALIITAIRDKGFTDKEIDFLLTLNRKIIS